MWRTHCAVKWNRLAWAVPAERWEGGKQVLPGRPSALPLQAHQGGLLWACNVEDLVGAQP